MTLAATAGGQPEPQAGQSRPVNNTIPFSPATSCSYALHLFQVLPTLTVGHSGYEDFCDADNEVGRADSEGAET